MPTKRLHPATSLLPTPTYPSKTPSSQAQPRPSVDSERTRTGSIFSLKKDILALQPHQEKEPGALKKGLKKGWHKFVQAAKEHHRSCNAAYQVVYGAGTYHGTCCHRGWTTAEMEKGMRVLEEGKGGDDEKVEKVEKA